MQQAVFVPAKLNDLAVDVSLSGAAQGDLFVHGASRWSNLPAGTSGLFLKTLGSGANPVWSGLSASDLAPSVILAPVGSARNVVQPAADDAVALALKGHSAGHSANLIELKNHLDVILSKFDFLGNLSIGTGLAGQASLLNLDGDSGTLRFSQLGVPRFQFYQNAGLPYLYLGDATNGRLQMYWTPGSAGTASTYVQDQIVVKAGSSGQGIDRQQWQGSDGAVDTRISKAGYIITARNTAPADGDLAAGDLAVWFDNQNAAPAVRFKAKQADGTVVQTAFLMT